jgi:hypothetical protein
VPVVLTCCESPGGPPDRHGASRIPRYPGRDRQLCDPFGGESTRMMCFHSSCCSPMLLYPLLLLLLLLPLSSFALSMADPISFGRVPSGSRIARQLRRAACRVWLRHQCGNTADIHATILPPSCLRYHHRCQASVMMMAMMIIMMPQILLWMTCPPPSPLFSSPLYPEG